MDIIVIEYPDGTLKSSPFHNRFGTLKILKTREKIINLYVNGIKSDLTMRLSSSGDGYFLQELKKSKEEENELEGISSEMMGSPVRGSSAPESPNLSPLKSNKNIDRVRKVSGM